MLATVEISSGCFIKMLIPAPKRSFTAEDLLITEDELPDGWISPWGPRKDTDTSRPSGSMEIALFKSQEAEIHDVDERAAIYPTIKGARVDFSEEAQFPGKTNIEGWSFTSSIADEQKFSCYTYSNLDYPICRWLARYQEIIIQVIGGIKPGRVNLDELQQIVKEIDERVTGNLNKISK